LRISSIKYTTILRECFEMIEIGQKKESVSKLVVSNHQVYARKVLRAH
jgi:hypothetical protein